MSKYAGTISGPIAPFNNVPIEADFYEPSQFFITAISIGATTTITTSVDHNYFIGQQVRLLIPVLYGAQQLNYAFGLVLSIPSATQVVLDINSSFANAFVANPITATITGISQTNPAVVTANNSFRTGNFVIISGVSGMTELNGRQFQAIEVNSTTLTLEVGQLLLSPYTGGGVATLVTQDQTRPQIIAIGDINSGKLNFNVNITSSPFIEGSFINISPG